MKTQFMFTLEQGRADISEPFEIGFETSGKIAVEHAGEILSEDVESYEVQIRIEPVVKETVPRGKLARLLLTVRGTPETHYPFAYRLATQITDHLGFYYDRLRLLGGHVGTERIPESEEEAALLGDKRFGAKVNVVEVPPPIPFDREHLRLFPFSGGLERAIRQFNAARDASSPIDGFIGMFKVVETLYHKGNLRAREALRRDAEFRGLLKNSFENVDDGVTSPPTDQDVDEMIAEFVEVRDNCAHLREHNAFGFAPGDPAVLGRVEPFLGILEDAARAAINQRIEARRATDARTRQLER